MSTQTTVSFLTYNPLAPAGETYTSELRVFNLEISQDAQTCYAGYMTALQSAMLSSDVAQMGTLLKDLDTWSRFQCVQNGQQVTISASIADTTTPGATIDVTTLGTMDRYMAEQVDTLLREFRAAGYDPVSGNFTKANTTIDDVATALFGTDASLYDVAGTITKAINAALQARISTDVWTQSQSIQQLLMVDYISRGNELLFNEMSQLKDAIDINQSTLAYLNSLQDLMNQKDPQHFIMALQDLSGSVGGQSSIYQQFEQDSFNQELQNVAKFSDDDISAYLRNILGLDPNSTTPPTAAQTSGTALGAFQALSPEYLTTTLNQYLTSKGLPATMETLLPALADNPTFSEPLGTFATSHSLTTSDQELIWRVFLVKEAGIGLPSDLVQLDEDGLPIGVDPALLTHFNTFLTAIAGATPATLEALLQTQLQTALSVKTDFQNVLKADAYQAYYSGISNLYPPSIPSVSQIENIIETNFTAYPLTDDDKLNIWRAFLITHGATEGDPPGIAPYRVDMTEQSNLDALGAYAKSISDLAPNYQGQLTASTLDDLGMNTLYPVHPYWTTFKETVKDAWTNCDNPSIIPISDALYLFIARYIFNDKVRSSNLQYWQIDIEDPDFLTYCTSTATSLSQHAQADNITTVDGLITHFLVAPPEAYATYYPPNTSSFDWYIGQIQASFANAPFTLTNDDERHIIQAYISVNNYTPATDLLDSTVLNNFSTYIGLLPHTSYLDLINQIIADTGIPTDGYPPNFISNYLADSICRNAITFHVVPTADVDSAILSLVRGFLASQSATFNIPPEDIGIAGIRVLFDAFINALPATVKNATTLAEFNNQLRTHLASPPWNVTLTPTELHEAYPPLLIPWENIKTIVEDNFTAYPLTDDEKLRFIQAAVAHVAAEQIPLKTPENLDLTDPAVRASFITYVKSMSDQSDFLQITLAHDAGTSDFSDLYPPSLGNLDHLMSIIDSTFTTITLSQTDKVNIVRAFLVVRNTVLQINKLDIDMSTPDNIAAFKLYVATVADRAPFLPVSSLTSLPDISINQYGESLDSKFSIANGYTDDDRLSIWKAFLISQGLSTDTTIVPGISASSVEFNKFIDAVTPYIESSTGTNLVNGLYAYLLGEKGFTTIDSAFPTMAELSGVGYATASGAEAAIKTTIGNSLPSSLYTDTDWLNIWRAYMIYNGDTDPDNYLLIQDVGPGSGLDIFAQDLKAQIGSAEITGSELVELLGTFALYPHQDTTYQALKQLLQQTLPSASYSDTDRLNYWKGFLAFYTTSPGAFTSVESIMFYQYILALRHTSGQVGQMTYPSGQDLVNLINATLYQQQTTTDPTSAPLFETLPSVTKAPATTTFSQYMDSVLGTTSLTDDQKVEIWNAYLATNVSGKSMIKTPTLTSDSIANFRTFLIALSSKDLGGALEERMSRIISNLQYLIDRISQIDSGASLKSQLEVLLHDFSTLSEDGQSITTWVEDYSAGRVGTYQKDLNDTIVASQGLNDTERESLRNVMFVYEEFYKSATSMLSNLNDLLVKMAAAMSR